MQGWAHRVVYIPRDHIHPPLLHCVYCRRLEVSFRKIHSSDVIMGTIASQITSHTIVYSTVYSDADQRKRQSSASLAFVRGIHRGPVNSPHKWPVRRNMFPFDDVIMWIHIGLGSRLLVGVEELIWCSFWFYWLIPPGQNGRHFADDIFRLIFVNEKFCSLIKISLKFVPKCPIDNNPALVI